MAGIQGAGSFDPYAASSKVLPSSLGALDNVPIPGRVKSRINLANGDRKRGWIHVLDRHFNSSKNASQFEVTPNELRSLLQSKPVVSTPISRVLESDQGLRYVREITLDTQPIGFDKLTQTRTSTFTVVSDKYGNLVTTFPGRLP